MAGTHSASFRPLPVVSVHKRATNKNIFSESSLVNSQYRSARANSVLGAHISAPHMSDDASKSSPGAAPGSAGATSMLIFRKYLLPVTLLDQTVVLDASGVVSKACFDEWVATRVVQTPNFDYEKSFQRALTAHLTGSDGRKPFKPEEEEAVLQVVRQKRAWPAFESLKCTVGQLGFRAMGYHERKRQTAMGDSASARALGSHAPGDVGEQQHEAPAGKAAAGRPKSAHRPHELLPALPLHAAAHADAMELEVMVAPSSPLPDTSEDCAYVYTGQADSKDGA